MLRRLENNKKFWNDRVKKYPYCVNHVRIGVIRPENYKECQHMSVGIGNRERIWGFETYDNAYDFTVYYAHHRDAGAPVLFVEANKGI